MGTSLGTLNTEITGSTFTPGGTRSRQSLQRVAGGDSPTRPAVGQGPATSEVPIEQSLIWTTSLPRSAYRSTRTRGSPVGYAHGPDGQCTSPKPRRNPEPGGDSRSPSVGDDSGRSGAPWRFRRSASGPLVPGQGIPGSSQVSPVAVSTRAALDTVSVTGSTSEIAVTATGSKAPGARVATETCGIHDVGR
jgi:hypothetical protein